MKIAFCSLLFAVAMPALSDNPSAAGQWQVHSSIAGNESDMVCTFAQKGEALSGNCSSERGKFEITGTASGSKISWSYKSEYEGTPLTVKYDGSLEQAGKIKGSVDVPEFGAGGDFTATRSSK